MAKKSSTKQAPNDFGGFRFINVSLTKEDKDKLAALDGSVEFGFELVLSLVEQGYKFSANIDTKHNAYVATLTDLNPDSPFFKHMLTGRGSNATFAWFSLAYKHFYMAQEDWTNFHIDLSDNGSDFG